MHIRCTNCGADVPIGESTRETVCDYCHTLLFVGRQTGIPHLVVAVYVSLSDAQLRLGRYLSKREVNAMPKAVECRVVYLPYWHLNFAKTPHNAKWLAASFSPLEALLDMAPKSGDTTSKTVLDVPPDALVEASLLPEDAVMTMATAGEAPALDEEHSATLIHVPFAHIRYRAAGELLDAYVDLVHGEVFADHVPHAPQTQKSIALGLVATLSLALVTVTVWKVPLGIQFVLLPLLLPGLYLGIMKLLSNRGW